jgi:hypothetical protein
MMVTVLGRFQEKEIMIAASKIAQWIANRGAVYAAPFWLKRRAVDLSYSKFDCRSGFAQPLFASVAACAAEKEPLYLVVATVAKMGQLHFHFHR